MRRIIWFTQEKDTFYLEHRAFGNKKTMGFPKISFVEKETFQIILCTFPEYYRKKTCFSGQQNWNIGMLLQLMQKCCVELAADTYYLSEDFGKGILPERNPLWTDRQRMSPEVWEFVLSQIKATEEIVFLTDSGELPHIPGALLRKVKRFYRMSDGQIPSGQWEWESYLWEEYGMPVLDVKDWKELHGDSDAGRVLVIDDWERCPCQMRIMPGQRIYYVDLWSSAEKCAYLGQLGSGGNREGRYPCAGIKYFSEYEIIRKLATNHSSGKSQ